MKDWIETTLKNIINVKHGFPFKSEYFASEGDYILLTPGNFYEEGGFKQQQGKEKFYTGTFPESYLLSKGDLIVAMTEQAEGLLGSTAIVPLDNLYLHNQRLGLITIDEKKIDKMFLYHLFKTEFIRQQIQGSSSGTKIKHTSPERICSVKVYLPSVEKQKKIAAVLSALDAKIELNNRINAELESLAKTIYDYWFVQFDFPFDFAQGKPNADGKPYKSSGGEMVYVEEGKGDRAIPAGWDVKELLDIALIIRGIPPKYIENGGICVLNQKCIRDKKINFEPSRRHDHNKLASASSKFIVDGDVLVNSTGVGTLGRVAFVRRLEEEITTVDSHIRIVRANFKIVKKFYFCYSMLDKQSEIEKFAEGSTGQVELSTLQLGQLKIIIPPMDLQEKFENMMAPVSQKIVNIEIENQQLTQLRDWLLPMLMNGQVSIK